MRLLIALLAGVVGWMFGRRQPSAPMRSPADPEILLLPVQPPPPGTRLMIVRAPRKLVGGKTLRVTARHYDGGGPVAGVDIRLVHVLSGDVLARGTTNARGLAELLTPTVSSVSTCEVESEKHGYAFYIPAEDPRAWTAQQGIYPVPPITLWPRSTSPTLSPTSPKFVIDVGFGIIGDAFHGANFDALEDKAGETGWDYSEDDWADRSQICENLGNLGPADVWMFSGHGKMMRSSNLADAIGTWKPGAWVPGLTYGRMLPDEICRCFSAKGGPGVIYLDACGSAGMLDALVACCAKTVIGWDRAVSSRRSGHATCEFWISMLAGNTLQQSLDIADNIMNRGWGGTGGSLVVKTKAWLGDVSGLTLEEILAARPAEEDE